MLWSDCLKWSPLGYATIILVTWGISLAIHFYYKVKVFLWFFKLFFIQWPNFSNYFFDFYFLFFGLWLMGEESGLLALLMGEKLDLLAYEILDILPSFFLFILYILKIFSLITIKTTNLSPIKIHLKSWYF